MVENWSFFYHFQFKLLLTNWHREVFYYSLKCIYLNYKHTQTIENIYKNFMEISHTKVRVKSDRKLERFLRVFLLQFNCDELIEWKGYQG